MVPDADAHQAALAAALPLLALVLVVLGALAALLAQPWWTERRRARLRARPFPPAWRRILRRRVPAVARLPADLPQRLAVWCRSGARRWPVSPGRKAG